MASATLVWFRHDLRLHDRPELLAAAALGPVVPVYVHAPDEDGDWAPGAASRYWLHRALQDVSEQLRARGSRLIRAGGSQRPGVGPGDRGDRRAAGRLEPELVARRRGAR